MKYWKMASWLCLAMSFQTYAILKGTIKYDGNEVELALLKVSNNIEISESSMEQTCRDYSNDSQLIRVSRRDARSLNISEMPSDSKIYMLFRDTDDMYYHSFRRLRRAGADVVENNGKAFVICTYKGELLASDGNKKDAEDSVIAAPQLPTNTSPQIKNDKVKPDFGETKNDVDLSELLTRSYWLVSRDISLAPLHQRVGSVWKFEKSGKVEINRKWQGEWSFESSNAITVYVEDLHYTLLFKDSYKQFRVFNRASEMLSIGYLIEDLAKFSDYSLLHGELSRVLTVFKTAIEVCYQMESTLSKCAPGMPGVPPVGQRDNNVTIKYKDGTLISEKETKVGYYRYTLRAEPVSEYQLKWIVTMEPLEDFIM